MSIYSEIVISLKDEPFNLMRVANSLTNRTIALCTKSRVMLYSENGEKHDHELQRPFPPTAIEWHPVERTLAIGWSNGTVTLWSEDLQQAETCVHNAEINLICFNTSGNRMVTADANGLVILWSGLTPINTYQKEGIMTHCVFLDLPNKLDNSNSFLFGGKAGKVYLADESKHCSQICKVDGSIKSLMIYEKENSVIIITSEMLLVQFKIQENSEPDRQVQLYTYGDRECVQFILIGQSLIATTSNQDSIKMWNMVKDEEYYLSLDKIYGIGNDKIEDERLCCTTYNQKTKLLISGTTEGRLFLWKNMASDESPYKSDQWKILQSTKQGKQVLEIQIGKNNGIIAARFADEVKIIYEIILQGKMDENVRIIQTDRNKICIYMLEDKVKKKYIQFMFEPQIDIMSIDCNSKHIMIHYANNKIEIHQLIDMSQVAVIDRKCVKALLYDVYLILLNKNAMELCDFNGVTKQIIHFEESDGIVKSAQMAGKNLIIWTNQYFRIYDLGKNEFNQVICKKFENSEGSLGVIRSCAINSDGSKIGILADTSSSKDRFMVYDLDVDTFFARESPEYSQAVQFQWDAIDPRFFAVLMNYTKPEDDDDELYPNKLFTYFYNAGIKQLNKQRFVEESILAIKIPHIYIKQKTTHKYKLTFRIYDGLMYEFEDIKELDEPTIKAVTNFLFHISSRNLYEAYKSVEVIQNPEVRGKMSQISVTKMSQNQDLTGLQEEQSFTNLSQKDPQILSGDDNGFIQGKIDENVRILQIEPHTILIQRREDQQQINSGNVLQTREIIKSIDFNSKHMIIHHAGDGIIFYRRINMEYLQSLERKCLKAMLYNEDLIVINQTTIELCNFKGVTKQAIFFNESDGIVKSAQMVGKNLILWTNYNFRIYDLGKQEFNEVIFKKFENSEGSLGLIRSCSINCDGSKVGILADTSTSKVRFMVFDLELDTFSVYENPEYRQAVEFHWDATDPRFFGVLMNYTKGTEDKEQEPNKLFTYFYNDGIEVQDSQSLDNDLVSILAIKMPILFIVYKIIFKEQQTYRIAEKLMNELGGNKQELVQE